MADKTPAELLKEIERLKSQLGESEAARTEAEQFAATMASTTAHLGNAEEQPTGRTMTQSVCLNPGVRDEKKQKFKDVQVPTYMYTIVLPEGAGTNLTTNGIAFYHGQTYEVDPDMLADLKSRVARCWDHEKAIHSENAQAYKQPTNLHLMSKAAAARARH